MINVRLTERPLVMAVIAGFALWIVVQIVERAVWVFVLILLALILAAAMMPVVRLLRSVRLPPKGWHIPKALAVIAIYLVGLLVLGLLGFVVGRTVAVDLVRLAETLPELGAELALRIDALTQAIGVPGVALSPEDIASQIQGLTTRAVEALRVVGIVAGGLISFLFQLFIVLTLSVFLVAESERILAFWVGLFPPSQRAKVNEVTMRIGRKVGYWLLAQMAVATISGTLAGIAAALLGLPYAALIGVTTAILDLAPVLGPGLMVIPVFLLGLSDSLILAIVAAVVFYGLAQLDGNVISPLITGRAVRVSPTLIIIVLTLGLALYGAIGVLVAVPVTAALQVVFHEVFLPWLRAKQGVPPEEQG